MDLSLTERLRSTTTTIYNDNSRLLSISMDSNHLLGEHKYNLWDRKVGRKVYSTMIYEEIIREYEKRRDEYDSKSN